MQGNRQDHSSTASVSRVWWGCPRKQFVLQGAHIDPRAGCRSSADLALSPVRRLGEEAPQTRKLPKLFGLMKLCDFLRLRAESNTRPLPLKASHGTSVSEKLIEREGSPRYQERIRKPAH
jgi:hypothetical protein